MLPRWPRRKRRERRSELFDSRKALRRVFFEASTNDDFETQRSLGAKLLQRRGPAVADEHTELRQRSRPKGRPPRNGLEQDHTDPPDVGPVVDVAGGFELLR